MTPDAPRPPRASRRTPAVAALHTAGVTTLAIAIAIATLGLVIYLGGNEVAFLLLLLGLVIFVLGIGLLTAARRLS
ncbi:hypothetical protein ITJ64_01265 [Herbiconiux sp. VKM Ac-1786]|uniref:hypothetical protein n=1 Tax=Herbiconiux sp. VKM Ac-1786 TaxID=2783824 RepID=UPI00188BA58C|nr:hypothetical protein [Herbiconiux sp. VKM Ac-1786]MBF4571141.1 hypothetical protein [Herbiconiux sp. VKM Ac-1786]